MIVLGTVSSELCNIGTLVDFYFNNNVGISCYAACLCTVTPLSTSGYACTETPTGQPSSEPTVAPPTPSDIGVCAFVAATNIVTKSNYANWVCDVSGYPTTDLCGWTGVTCAGSAVIELYLQSLEISGSIPTELGSLTSLTYLALDYNRLTGMWCVLVVLLLWLTVYHVLLCHVLLCGILYYLVY